MKTSGKDFSHSVRSTNESNCKPSPKRSGRFQGIPLFSRIGRSASFTGRKPDKSREELAYAKTPTQNRRNYEDIEPIWSDNYVMDPFVISKEQSSFGAVERREVRQTRKVLGKENHKKRSVSKATKDSHGTGRVVANVVQESRRMTGMNSGFRTYPYNKFYEQNSGNTPVWLLNPPRILIQDCSYYSDEDGLTSDEEYFQQAEWALEILQKNCMWRKEDHELQEAMAMVALPVARQDSPVKANHISTNTRTNFDAIFQPFSTGAATMIETGAKLADFTSRVWKGMQFDLLRRNRDDTTTPLSKEDELFLTNEDIS